MRTVDHMTHFSHDMNFKITFLFSTFVFWQVYFYDKSHNTKTVDVLIKQNNKIIAKCLVPVATCREGCTRYLWRVVKLKQNNYLSVQSSNNINIMMSEDMTFFGANLLKRDRFSKRLYR